MPACNITEPFSCPQLLPTTFNHSIRLFYILAMQQLPSILPPPPLPDGTEAPPRPPDRQANLIRFQSELEVSGSHPAFVSPRLEDIALTFPSSSNVSQTRCTSASFPYRATSPSPNSSITSNTSSTGVTPNMSGSSCEFSTLAAYYT